MPPAGRSWASLSESTQSRYLGAWRSGKANGTKHSGTDAQLRAQVRRWYENPKNKLGGARGHRNPAQEPAERKKRAAKKPIARRRREAAQAIARGDATPAQERLFRDWRKSKAFPSWIPKDEGKMGIDTAAILTSLPGPPSRWSGVVFSPGPDGTILMRIQRRGANQYGPYPSVTVTLPDYDAYLDVLRWLRSDTRAIDVAALGS